MDVHAKCREMSLADEVAHLEERLLVKKAILGQLESGKDESGRGEAPMPLLPTSEPDRKLGTIVEIAEVRDHPNADSLALAKVRGWQVVTNKVRDGYKAGMRAVYMEIDTVVPEEILVGRAEHEILKKKRFLIKTAKIRGEISQGILFPLDVLDGKAPSDLPVGADVTAALGLRKYDPPEHTGVGKPFPTAIPKTDEERVQNLDGTWGDEFYVTEKLDGCSFTACMINGAFSVCSRNLIVLDRTTPHWRGAENIDVERRLRESGRDNIAIQGELVGPKVACNRYHLPQLTVFFFSVFDIASQQYLALDEAEAFVRALGLEWVPVVSRSLRLDGMSCADILTMADGPSALYKKQQREGLVFRTVNAHGRKHRPSFKAISNKFLLSLKD
eukprot:Sspe_Gene.93056::Locus_65771_Transcript_1_1_Confidence_1.000_Length_1999::g.93056::m.93056